jgi:hypothetical protein
MCFIIVSQPKTNHRIPTRRCAVDKSTCVLHLKRPNPLIVHISKSFLDPKCSA